MSRWVCQAVLSALVFVGITSCRRLPPTEPTSQTDAALIERFTLALQYPPAVLAIVRPNRVQSGRGVLERAVHDVAERGRGGLLQIVEALLDGALKDARGWDRARPVLVALDGTEGREDLSLLFRTVMQDPGNVAPRACHHRLAVPAIDAHSLAASIADLLVARGASRRPQLSARRAILALSDSGFAAISEEPDAVLVDVVTDEFPLSRDENAAYQRFRTSLEKGTSQTPAAVPFAELQGSGTDALVVHVRPAALYRAQLQAWLGVVGRIRLLADAADKRSLIAKGAGDLLGAYLLTSAPTDATESEIALGLSLVDAPALRIAANDERAEIDGFDVEGASGIKLTRTQTGARIDGRFPLLVDAGAYAAAAKKVGVNGITAAELAEDLDACGSVCAGGILAKHPGRALAALAGMTGAEKSGLPFTARLDAAHVSGERGAVSRCDFGVVRAMRKTFDAIATPGADEDVRYTAGMAALRASFGCWATGAIPEPMRQIQLAATLADAERLVAALRRKEAIAVLREPCGLGEVEACARMRLIAEIPEVGLPPLETRCALPLPDRGAVTLTVDARGRSHSGPAKPDVPGAIVVEADKDAPHAAVVDALSRLPPGVVSLAVRTAGAAMLGLRAQGKDPPGGSLNPSIGALRYSPTRAEVTLVFPGQPTLNAKVSTTCSTSGPCPLALALDQLQSRIGRAPPVVVEMAKGARWSDTVNLVANALCKGPSGELNAAASHVMLLRPSDENALGDRH